MPFDGANHDAMFRQEEKLEQWEGKKINLKTENIFHMY